MRYSIGKQILGGCSPTTTTLEVIFYTCILIGLLVLFIAAYSAIGATGRRPTDCSWRCRWQYNTMELY
jgi:hypothetical protein